MVLLSDRLKSLTRPEPEDFDPEDAEDYVRRSSPGNIASSSHYVDVGRRSLANEAPEVDEIRYQSAPALRKHVAETFMDVGESSEELSESEADPDRSSGLRSGIGRKEHVGSDSESERGKMSETADTLRSILKNENEHLLSRLASSNVSEAVKGKAIDGQMRLYDNLLGARIALQKLLNSSLSVSASPNELSTALAAVGDVIEGTVNLRSKLQKSEYDAGGLSNVSRWSNLAKQSELLDKHLVTHRNATLARWGRKVQLTNASRAIQSTKFKSLNQSPEIQVASGLADMDALIARTRIDRAGQEPQLHGFFNDGDFYQSLLKDLIDHRMGDSSAINGFKWNTKRVKAKRNKDNRVSKGRKLRFDVQEKVQGFDAPRQVYSWTANQAEELFSNLLGQKITMDDEELPERIVEPDVIADDGFALFA